MFYAEGLPTIDSLHRRPFARAIAHGLVATSEPSSFTVGIESEWGTGKSTLLSYIVSELEAGDEKTRPLILTFSPWIISGFSSLLESFFLALAKKLETSLLPNGQRAVVASKKVIKYLALLEHAKYLKYVPGTGAFGSIAEDVGAWAREATKAGDEASKQILNLLPKSTVESQRAAVEAALAELRRPVIVTIDDIDRLTGKEIRQVFQLVKAIGALNYTRYVITYDPAIVARALGPDGNLNEGRRYLQKIVQIQYRLPHIFAWQIHELLQVQIRDLILALSLAKDLSSDSRFEEALAICSTLCHTPRDVLRLKNKLSISLLATKDAVSAADVLVYEAIDLLFPAVSAAFRRFPADFLHAEFSSPVDDMSYELSFAELAETNSSGEKQASWRRFLPSEADDANAVARAILFLFEQLQGESDGSRGVAADRVVHIEVFQRLLLVTGHPAQLDGAVAKRVLQSSGELSKLITARREELITVLQLLTLHARTTKIPAIADAFRILFAAYGELNSMRPLNFDEAKAFGRLILEMMHGQRAESGRLLKSVAREAPLSLGHDVVLEMAEEHGLWVPKPASVERLEERLVQSPEDVVEAIRIWRGRVSVTTPEGLFQEARPLSIVFRYEQLGQEKDAGVRLFRKLFDADAFRALALAINSEGHLAQVDNLKVMPSPDELRAVIEKDDLLRKTYRTLYADLESDKVRQFAELLKQSRGSRGESAA